MPFKTTDGRVIQPDRAFTLGDISYPATWIRNASEAEKEAIGLTWQDPPETQFKDSRYYDNHVAPDGTVTSTPKDVEQLKANLVGDAKRTANTLLDGSDWMVSANHERGRLMSEEWADYRADVLAECERQETAIKAAADIEALLEVKANWPINPDEQAQLDKQLAEAQAAEAEQENLNNA
jgi:hypothetical protein